MTIPLDKQSYEFLHRINDGPITSIYAARCINTGKIVCVKVTDLDAINSTNFLKLRSILSFWRQSKTANVVQYYGSFVEESKLYFISEYMDGGSIRDILQFAYKKGLKDEVLIASILEPVIKFLVFFHENNQIHRSISPDCLFVSTSGDVKVGAFGAAKDLINNGKAQRSTNTALENRYWAPEMAADKDGYTSKVDIWSLGITAIELSTGKNPYSGLSDLNAVLAIMSKNPPEVDTKSGFSHKFADFVKMCLQANPEKRATAEKLLKTPFIKLSKGSKYIASTLMCNMPSIYQRFKQTRQNIVPDLIDKAAREPIVFDFSTGESNQYGEEVVEQREEEEEKVVEAEHVEPVSEEPVMKEVKLGRFNVTYTLSPEKRKTSLDPRAVMLTKSASKNFITKHGNEYSIDPKAGMLKVCVSSSNLSEASSPNKFEEISEKIKKLSERSQKLGEAQQATSNTVNDLQKLIDSMKTTA